MDKLFPDRVVLEIKATEYARLSLYRFYRKLQARQLSFLVQNAMKTQDVALRLKNHTLY